MANVGYASLQIIPSMRGIAEEIRRQLAPAAGEGQRAGEQTGGGFGSAFKGALAAIGLEKAAEKIAEGVSEAFSSAVEQSGMPGRIKAQLGATAPDAARYGDIAGKLYAAGITDSMESGAEDIRAVVSAGLAPPAATNAQLQSISTKVADVASTFDQDLGGVTNAVSQMLRTGLATNADQALDIITKGFQAAGTKGDDLLDTVNEYGVQFQKLGITGTTAMGLISQGLKGGARDTDLVADSLKEFSLRSIDMSTTSVAAYKGLGLSAKGMSKQIAEGGAGATAGLQTVLDRLRGIKDPVKQSALAVGLFGTQAEDMGKALYSLDPSKAAKAIGDVGGAADQMGTDLRDNAGARITAFKRTLQQGLVNVIGGQVLPRLLAIGTTVQTKVGPPLSKLGTVLSTKVGPAMDATGHFITDDLVPGLMAAAGWVHRNATALEIAAGVVTAVMLPLLLTLAVSYATAGAAAVVSSAQQVGAWVASSAGAVVSAATQVAASYRTVGGWIVMGATSITSGARVVGGWVLTGAAAVAGAVTQAVSAAGVVAGWVLMGIQSLIQAGRMAAAWIIALGPIGWVTAAVIGIVVLIIANWSTISSWTSRIWRAVSDWVTGAISTVVAFAKAHWPLLLAILTGPIGLAVYGIVHYWSQITSAFSGAWSTVRSAGASAVAWVSGLPGRIAGALGALGARVYSVAASGFARLQAAASAKAAGLLTYVSGIPGRIKSGLGDLSSLLTSSGRDVITGLWTGISSMGGWLSSKVSGLVHDSIPGPVRKVLGIHSPSKVMAELGRYAGEGLVQGLTGTTSQVDAASKKVADQVRKAFSEATADQIAKDKKNLAALAKQRTAALTRLNAAEDKLHAAGASKSAKAAARRTIASQQAALKSIASQEAGARRDIASQQRIAKAGKALSKVVAADNTKLATLAKQRDGVAGKLKAAQDKLADIRKSWTDLRDQVASGIVSGASITRAMPEGTDTTASSILARLRTDVKAAKTFAAELSDLRKRGLNADLITQIAQAGVDQGGATAAALAAATPEQIKAINEQQAALAKAADAAGAAAADAMYKSGIQAAQGVVDGLKAQQGAIEKQMLAIATSMQKAIRTALGIKSPSRVMAGVGRFVGLGLIAGVDGQRGQVEAAMRRLVAVPPAPAVGITGGPAGTPRAGQGATVHVSYHAPIPENPQKAALEMGRRLMAAVSI